MNSILFLYTLLQQNSTEIPDQFYSSKQPALYHLSRFSHPNYTSTPINYNNQQGLNWGCNSALSSNSPCIGYDLSDITEESCLSLGCCWNEEDRSCLEKIIWKWKTDDYLNYIVRDGIVIERPDDETPSVTSIGSIPGLELNTEIESCGRTGKNLRSRIIAGETAGNAEWPWAVGERF